MNAQRLFGQRRPFVCTVSPASRKAVQDLARMRRRPVRAFFTSNGTIWVDDYDPAKHQQDFVIAYDEKGDEIQRTEHAPG